MKSRKELTASEMAEVRSCLDRLGAEAPSVRAIAHGPGLGIADSGADYALIVDFDDSDGWRAYSEHPAHDLPREVVGRLMAETRATQFAMPD
jgi:hypothetical protein